MSGQIVNIDQAKTQLSKLIEVVQSGGEIVIAQSGTPVAKLVPFTPTKRTIAPPGAMAGQIRIDDIFDEPVDDLFECLANGANADQ